MCDGYIFPGRGDVGGARLKLAENVVTAEPPALTVPARETLICWRFLRHRDVLIIARMAMNQRP
jgi:hypothetical protein